jgi:hypothetical protein
MRLLAGSILSFSHWERERLRERERFFGMDRWFGFLLSSFPHKEFRSQSLLNVESWKKGTSQGNETHFLIF